MNTTAYKWHVYFVLFTLYFNCILFPFLHSFGRTHIFTFYKSLTWHIQGSSAGSGRPEGRGDKKKKKEKKIFFTEHGPKLSTGGWSIKCSSGGYINPYPGPLCTCMKALLFSPPFLRSSLIFLSSNPPPPPPSPLANTMSCAK